MAMTLFDDELTLPGVITQIVPDYSSGYDTSSWGTTESVTIIGTAFNGPVGKPIAVYTPEQAKYIFGDSFDPATQREASLVAEIYDAWERGCRTIYAIRVSGKEMYKDFELATESDLKLRLSGYFPCNSNKSCFMTYQATQGSEKAFGDNEGIIRIYKPADRTVISEKIAGVVNNLDSILVAEINLDANGFSKSSRLCDVLDLVNGLESNNVLTLSLVDEQGIPRTNATKEVQEITVGSLFPGIYTLCRDEATSEVNVLTDIEVIRNSDTPLYPQCTSTLWKKLVINTDPSKPYPLGAALISDFKKQLPVSLEVDEKYDFLKKIGAIDAIAVKNNIDYEEVDMEGFDLYKKLGCGFARTATLKEMGTSGGEKKYKVIPAPDGDEYRVVGIEDGIYSVLQMHESDYIVLAAATAETKTSGKLPKRTEFLRSQAKSVKLASTTYPDGLISALCKIDNTDIKSSRVKYNFSLNKLPETITHDKVMENLVSSKIIRLPRLTTGDPITGEVKKNQLVLADDTKLQKFNGKTFVDSEDKDINYDYVISETDNGLKIFKCTKNRDAYTNAFTELTSDTIKADFFTEGDAPTQKYIIGLCEDEANVYILKDDATIKPLMSLQDLSEGLLKEDDYILCFKEKDIPVLNEEHPNNTYIGLYSNMLEYCSIEEFVEELNELKSLSTKFLFEVGSIDIAVNDFPENEEITGTEYNKELKPVYDTTLHIPYTTTDNFARHLAQHCLYTSLKTYPTHGVIGCERLTGISLNTIASRIDEICSLDLDMYAKKNNGNNMLDNKNTPHPIGRCLSVTFMQYAITTGNGYNYISAGAAGYAGMVSTLDADRSSTNQPINIDELMFTLSNYQLTRLNTAGIVCCRESTTNGIVVVDGITQAPATSAYRRLSTTKIINAIGRILKEAIEPYIGLPQTLAYMNSMETAIKSALNKVTGVLINDYNYEIVTDANASKLGIVKINYTIVPAYEIREVRNTVTITATN